jgi:cytochrome c peroxidase
MKRIQLLASASLLGLIFLQCEPFEQANRAELKLDLPETSFEYNVPGASNQLATLGRVLFYDPRLSINNTVSCGSCHKQALAFSDNVRFSRGFENRLTTRNSMPIQNIISNVFSTNLTTADKPDSIILINPKGESLPAGYLPGVVSPPTFFSKPSALFWDGREHELDVMVTRPIINHIEMGIHDLETLAQKLSKVPDYQILFANAFDKKEFTSGNISLGLSAFLLSIRSNQSKLDKALSGGAGLSGLEILGKDLFFNKFNCNACHESNGFANIGLDRVTGDAGQFLITGNSDDAGKFKIPSLRNVQLTAPYMHDGRFSSLEEVLDHYSTGINNNVNLDFRFRAPDGNPKQLNISASEKKAIIAFLNSLTDYDMITDARLANPFKAN